MPMEWFDDPTPFLDKPCDVMMGMVKELMKATMRGLSFAEIRLEESLKYLDNMVRISDKERERKVNAYVQDLEVRDAAIGRYKLLIAK